MRKPIIAGNWKMNLAPSEAKELIAEIAKNELNQDVEAVVCVPAIDLSVAKDALEGKGIGLGAQNMYFEESGAFTGEISPTMLNDLDVEYVILGHSERREIFKEDDVLINQKILSAFKHDLKPILCVGETLEEREAGKEKDKVATQLRAGLENVSDADLEKMVIAYEPIWAIGTGKTASAEDAEEMCKEIRELLRKSHGDTADKVRIQYGGSVKPGNVKEIMAKPNIDGALVGGASLKADSFVALVNFEN